MITAKYLWGLFFLSALLFNSLNAKAQIDSVKLMQVKNVLFDSACLCISTADTNLINTGADVQQLIIHCFTSNMQRVREYFLASGIDTTTLNQENGTKISLHLALETIQSCSYMQVLVKRVKYKSKSN